MLASRDMWLHGGLWPPAGILDIARLLDEPLPPAAQLTMEDPA